MDTPLAIPTSNLAQQIGQAKQLQASLAAIPAPSLSALNMGAAPAPSIPAPSMPDVVMSKSAQSSPVTPEQNDLNHLNYLKFSPDGISQIHNPVLRGLARTADVIGSVFAPRLDMAIPGTNLHHEMLVNQAQNQVNTDLGMDNKQAVTAQDQAQARHLNDESQILEAPSAPEYDYQQTPDGLMAVQKGTTKALPVTTASGAPVLAPEDLTKVYAHRVSQVINAGGDPSKDPIVGRLSDAITSLQPGQNKPVSGQHVNLAGPTGPIAATYHPDTGKYTDAAGKEIANPVPYEKPVTVNVGQAQGALDRETKQFGAAHQKAVDSANSQLEKIDEANSMLAANNPETQALGIPKVMTALVSGAGSGVRITQAELNAIASARGISGDFQGWMNSISGQGKMTPAQTKQLQAVLADVRNRVLEKQAIASGALDTINGAGDRQSIIAADTKARKQMNDLERYGHYEGQAVHLKNGQTIVIQHVHPDGSFD